uniref:ENT domain-containing protein n=1 Tax=Setaria viridis TaxID=4556 RepID=A0A4U6SZE6_SETVI|nr:hypothetical protein SEVIR_9G244900v2 [Setaria viridis]
MFLQSQVKLLTKLRNELRISHNEHKEVLVKVSSNENIKSLRKFSLANFSVLRKTNPSFDAHAVVHDKICSTGQISTSSTSCLSLLQPSPISEHSMSTTRGIGISDSSNGAKEGAYFEPHEVVSAKRFKSVNGHALAYLKCASSDQLPVAVSAVMEKGRTNDTLDSETTSCEVKSGCTSSPIFQEKHSESNAGQIPSCVDHDRQESGKRKAEVPGMRASTSLGVMDQTYGIKHQRRRNKDSDLEHGSEIINLCPTANLLDEVERLLRENPDPANLEKAKSILKVQEKDLLDALVKLSEASYDAVYFSANGQPGNTHDDGKADEEVLPNPANSSDETPPVTTRQAGAGAGNHVKIQGVAATALPLSTAPPSLMQTRPSLAPASPSSAPAALGESSRGLSTAHQPHAQPVVVGSASAPPAPPSKTRLIITKRKTTAEQRWRMWEFAHRVGWSIQKAGADAVDAFCAQVGVPERALRNWMANNRRLAKVPPPSSPPPRSTIKRTKTTAEQRKRMWEFAHRVGWSIQKAGADAVDAFCAQVGVPERALRNWMANNRRLAKVPPPSSPPPRSIIKRTKTTAEQRKRMREFAYRVGWSIQKAGAGAVDALCAQVGVPECALRNWMANNRHLANVPPPSLSSPPLPSHHQVQDHPPADTPPQGSMTEQGKSPEPEAAAAPADDGAGKGDEDEEASEVTQRGRGHRARKPNKCYADSFWM